MQHEVRKIGQEMLTELKRHVGIFREMEARNHELIERWQKLSPKVDQNDQKSQKLLRKFRLFLEESEGRERGRKELSDRLKAILDGEEKLEDCQRMLTERKQELLSYAREINALLRGGN